MFMVSSAYRCAVTGWKRGNGRVRGYLERQSSTMSGCACLVSRPCYQIMRDGSNE